MEKKISITIAEVPSPHSDAARAFLEKLRALPQDIPRFTPANKGAARKLSGTTAVPDSLLETAGVVLDRFERIAVAVGASSTTVRDSFGYALAYDPVVKELRALARSVAYTLRLQRAEAVKFALDVYAVARRLSQQADGAELVPYVEDMQSKLASRGRKAAKAAVPAVDTNTPK